MSDDFEPIEPNNAGAAASVHILGLATLLAIAYAVLHGGLPSGLLPDSNAQRMVGIGATSGAMAIAFGLVFSRSLVLKIIGVLGLLGSVMGFLWLFPQLVR